MPTRKKNLQYRCTKCRVKTKSFNIYDELKKYQVKQGWKEVSSQNFLCSSCVAKEKKQEQKAE